jgi:hypothetical protein
MRATSIPIFNDKLLEVFTRQRDTIYDGFEVWMVSDIGGKQTLLNHFLTHNGLEASLSYSAAGDLVWRDAQESDIPNEKTKLAEEAEIYFKKGTFWDLDDLGHHFNCTSSIPKERKALNAAKKAFIGTWTDGVATVTFGSDSKLTIQCPDAPSHPLHYLASSHHADWWNFAHWMLWLMNDAKKSGERMKVWRCDEHELHLVSKQRDKLAHVFRRV